MRASRPGSFINSRIAAASFSPPRSDWRNTSAAPDAASAAAFFSW